MTYKPISNNIPRSRRAPQRSIATKVKAVVASLLIGAGGGHILWNHLNVQDHFDQGLQNSPVVLEIESQALALANEIKPDADFVGIENLTWFRDDAPILLDEPELAAVSGSLIDKDGKRTHISITVPINTANKDAAKGGIAITHDREAKLRIGGRTYSFDLSALNGQDIVKQTPTPKTSRALGD